MMGHFYDDFRPEGDHVDEEEDTKLAPYTVFSPAGTKAVDGPEDDQRSSPANDTTCSAICKTTGVRCKRNAGREPSCTLHAAVPEDASSLRCSYIGKGGIRCRVIPKGGKGRCGVHAVRLDFKPCPDCPANAWIRHTSARCSQCCQRRNNASTLRQQRDSLAADLELMTDRVRQMQLEAVLAI